MTDPNWVRQAVAPTPAIAYAHKLGRGKLTDRQIELLLGAIDPAFVQTKSSGAKVSYFAQHQARAQMNRIFGYGNWDSRVLEMQQMYEYQEAGTGNNAGKMYWIVGYRSLVEVTVRDLWGMPLATYSEWHAEENAKQPNRGEAHALALTSVESYALRRALINMGDQFGLSLYNNGQMAPHGIWTAQLDAGYSFTWVDANAGPRPGGAPAPVGPAEAPRPEHQQAVADGEWDQPTADGQESIAVANEQQPGFQQSPQMRRFGEVQQGMQADREASRAGAASRLQQGLKTDVPYEQTMKAQDEGMYP